MSTAEHHESNRAFYDRIAHVYDHLADSNERAARLVGVEALNLRPGERVLELGFGTGNEVIDLAQLVGANGTVAGIDISSGMLAVAQKKLADAKPPGQIDLRLADARQLPFADGSFDAVYSSFTLELFPEADIPIVLAEVKRVLRAGGRLSVVSMALVKEGVRPSVLEHVYVWMHRHFPHIVDCRPIDVAGVIRAAGLTVRQQKELSIWSLAVAAVVGEKAVVRPSC